jgi:hypothetical protein
MDDGFKKPDDVVAKEMESRDVERAQGDEGPNEKDNELVAVATTASERLHFSKARTVALVATVAAAPFLSVRWSPRTNVVDTPNTSATDLFGSSHNNKPTQRGLGPWCPYQ